MGVADEVKSRLDIVEVIQGYVPLKKAGRTYKALCPFHAEKTPSFVVFPESGTWRCFGACQTGGDVFSFIQKRENLDFADALRMLAARAGVALGPQPDETPAEEQHLEKLRAALAAATTYYHQQLLHYPQAERARAHLAKRGLLTEVVTRFQLGYALDAWDAVLTHLTERGYALEDLEAAGLLVKRDDGTGYFDRFRNRLMIPIRDVQGRVIGFGARALEDAQQPKYLNSPQTPLFDKSRILFGLDAAKQAIRAADVAVIVEGYMDVLAAHQYNQANVVASMGTALTETQLRQLKRYSSHIVLALDADEAGARATLRGLEVAREALDRESVPVPTAEGLFRFEGRLKADLRVLTLPPGQDPDDVIKADVAQWQKSVAEAEPLVDFYLRTALADLDLGAAKGKSEAVRRLAPLLREIADPVERAHYVGRLARLAQTSEETVRQAIERAAREEGRARKPAARREASPGPKPQPAPPPQRPVREDYCLTSLLRGQTPLARVQSDLYNLKARPLGADDFANGENRTIFLALENAYLDDGGRLVATTQARLPEALQPRLEALLSLAATGPAMSDEDAAKDLVDSILRLREERLRHSLTELQYLLEDAKSSGDSESIAHFGQLIRSQSADRDQLQKLLYSRTLQGRRQAMTETV
ncbi:MAG: DNA primase [Anaerolineae bacterium]|nr:DNA primase [Anaerolineae bacterium]